MTPRQRVLAALDHRETSWVPLDVGATNVTGIHRVVCQPFLAERGYRGELKTLDPRLGLAVIDREARDLLGVDAAMVAQGGPSPDRYTMSIETRGDSAELHDEFGVLWRMPLDQGLYFDMVEHPLSGDISLSDVERYPWPDPVDPHRFADMAAKAAAIVRTEERATCFGNISTGLFELGIRMRGYESFFIDMLADRPIAEALLDKAADLKIAYWEQVIAAAGDMIDVVVDTDDYGTQHSLMVSPDSWRELIKPRLRRINDLIHAKSRAKVLLHSCGAIKELIPDLIDAGVDVLNPVQVSAKDMDTAALKREFGREIVFWGGGIDTQTTLPSGSPEAVRDEVRRRVEDLMKGGGFVFAAVHNIQPDVPVRNVVAMLETIAEYRGGRSSVPSGA